MMKRSYIAVGSTAIGAMGQLIQRCREENKADQSLAFYAIDSDQGHLDRIRRLDKRGVGRVKTFKMELAADDKTSQLVHQFRDRWVNLSIPQDGVAGDRRRSFACLNWQVDELLAPLSELEQGDEIILLGTAFGGTSTGVFWNMSYRIRSIISGSGRAGYPHFYAFLGLPAPPSVAATDYPLARNLCGFLQDMHAYEFAERMQRDQNLPFRMLSYSRYDGHGNYMPIWSPDACGVSDHSYLPVDVIFVVPTPDSGITALQETMAEQAFLIGPMALWKELNIPGRTVDLGPAGNRQSMEARCFSGLNMVAARSGKNAALHITYTTLFGTRWRNFRGGVSADDSRGKQWAEKALRTQMENTVPPFPEARVLEPFKKMIQNPVPEIENSVEQKMDDLEKSLRTHPYSWPDFPKFIGVLADQDVKSIPPDLALREIEHAYNRQHATVADAAQSIGSVKDRIRRAVKGARTFIRKRTRSKVAGLMGYRDRAQSEVEGQMREALTELLGYFVDACRSAATTPSLTPVIDHDTEVRGDKYKRLDAYFGTDAESGRAPKPPGFIAESNSASVDLSGLHQVLENSRLNRTVLHCLAAQDDAAFERVVTEEKETAVSDMTDYAKTLGAADPLRQMTVTFGSPPEVTPFSPVFKVDQLDNWANGFYIEMGAAESLRWEQLERSANGFGLSAFASLDSNRVGNQTFDPLRYFNPANRGFYYGAKDENSAGVHGVWLGTAQLNAEIGPVLAQAYPDSQLRNWQLSVAREITAGGGSPNKLFTLPEFVALGVILGAVEVNLNAMIKQPGQTVDAALTRHFKIVKRIGDSPTPLTIRPEKVNECFKPDHAGQSLTFLQIPLHWIEPLMEWLNGSFWDDVEMSGAGEFRNQLELEMNILTDIRLHISGEMRNQLNELMEKTARIVGPDWTD